jgi:hypothetical protein
VDISAPYIIWHPQHVEIIAIQRPFGNAVLLCLFDNVVLHPITGQ